MIEVHIDPSEVVSVSHDVILGNINAREGIDRCQCGSKYWENDRCIDCNTMVEVSRIWHDADVSRYMNEVKLNVLVTTMVHYDLPWMRDFATTHDLVTVTNKYRDMGVIK